MFTLDQLKTELRRIDDHAEPGAWPSAALTALDAADCWQRILPATAGAPVDPRTILETYEAVAWGSLTTALILTQHVAAAELLADCDNPTARDHLLPTLASGQQLATVGISQLTTSRRHGRIAMRAERHADGYRLNGIMPWVTSAAKADWLVTGGVLPDGNQILACVKRETAGLGVDPPMALMALDGSWTSQVRCRKVAIGPRELLRGPADGVLHRRSAVKPLTVSVVGLGVAGAILQDLRELVDPQPELSDLFHKTIAPCYQALRARVLAAAELLDDPQAEVPGGEIRVAVNDLLTRLAPSLLVAAKGSGYVGGHRAERRVREAAFFQVWSAPDTVRLGTLRQLWHNADDAKD